MIFYAGNTVHFIQSEALRVAVSVVVDVFEAILGALAVILRMVLRVGALWQQGRVDRVLVHPQLLLFYFFAHNHK